MSLNRVEHLVYEYVMDHGEERQHWTTKVRGFVTGCQGVADATARLDSELWRYYLERSSVAAAFREDARTYGTKRVSMKNLAELLIRLWTEPRPMTPAIPPQEMI
jgi:hypothetical protein